MLTRKQPLRRSTGEARASVPVRRLRKCKAPGCGEKFRPARAMQCACSPECALAVGQQNRIKQERAEFKRRKEAARPRSDWVKLAQAAFNKWVRLRDCAMPCISCGRFHQGSHDAGHYLTAGARPELRFDPNNVHRQCVPCNQHKHGNVAAYRLGLIQRIGVEAVESLEGPHPARKWSVDELKAIRDEYRTKAKGLSA